jgi:lipoyl(octanoyl) transferase
MACVFAAVPLSILEAETVSAFPVVVIRALGRVEYVPTWHAMQTFTANRTPDTPDEIWCVEHPPVYTLGLNGSPDNLLHASEVPVVRVDRGGQITYHGPGQAVLYLLLDLRRRDLGVRELVRRMERAVIALLAEEGIAAEGRVDAPGVYVGDAKIAALGLRVRNGCCYHGLALNVDVDLAPFGHINPCGHAGQSVIRTRALGSDLTVESAGRRLSAALVRHIDPAGACR